MRGRGPSRCGTQRDLDRTDLAQHLLGEHVADVAEMGRVHRPSSSIHERGVAAALRAPPVIAEGAHAGDEHLVHLVLARRVDQERGFEAGRTNDCSAVGLWAARLPRTGRACIVGVAVRADVRGQATSGGSRRSTGRRRPRRRPRDLAARTHVSPEPGDLHAMVPEHGRGTAGRCRRTKENEGRLPNRRPSFRGREREQEAMLHSSAAINLATDHEGTRRETVKKRTPSGTMAR